VGDVEVVVADVVAFVDIVVDIVAVFDIAVAVAVVVVAGNYINSC
jgi:hypothetical protein